MGDVLIVDADAKTRELLRTAAVAAGRSVRAVDAWPAAMQAVADGGYDLVVGTRVPNMCEWAAASGVSLVRVSPGAVHPDAASLRLVFETDPLAAARVMAERLPPVTVDAAPPAVGLSAAPRRTA